MGMESNALAFLRRYRYAFGFAGVSVVPGFQW